MGFHLLLVYVMLKKVSAITFFGDLKNEFDVPLILKVLLLNIIVFVSDLTSVYFYGL